MTYRNVVVAAGGAIVTVTVNRPKVLNALDDATLRELTDVFLALGGETRRFAA